MYNFSGSPSIGPSACQYLTDNKFSLILIYRCVFSIANNFFAIPFKPKVANNHRWLRQAHVIRCTISNWTYTHAWNSYQDGLEEIAVLIFHESVRFLTLTTY